MKRGIFTTSLFLVSASFLAACGDTNEGNNQEENNQTANENENTEQEQNEENNSAGAEGGSIEIGLNNWTENISTSNMWRVLLEEEGYDVTLTMLDKAPIWVGVSSGELDASLQVWLPTTDEPFYEEHQDDIELGDYWYEGTRLGLVVPEYVDVNSIEELNENAEMFDEEIVGIDAGASLTRLTEEAVEVYDLDYELLISSEPAMMGELDTAYGNEEPVLVTLWNPHWSFAEYDLKYLEDPENVFGDPEDINYMTRLGFEEEFPEVKEWWDNWEMDDDSLGELMAYVNEHGEEEGAQQWVDENRDLTDEWLNK